MSTDYDVEAHLEEELNKIPEDDEDESVREEEQISKVELDDKEFGKCFSDELKLLEKASQSFYHEYEAFLKRSEEPLVQSSGNISKKNIEKIEILPEYLLLGETDEESEEDVEIPPELFGSNSNALVQENEKENANIVLGWMETEKVLNRMNEERWNVMTEIIKRDEARCLSGRIKFQEAMEVELANKKKRNETTNHQATLNSGRLQEEEMKKALTVIEEDMAEERRRCDALQSELRHTEEERQRKAALIIQKSYRGYRIRRRIGAEVASRCAVGRRKMEKKQIILAEKNIQLHKARQFEKLRKQKQSASSSPCGDDLEKGGSVMSQTMEMVALYEAIEIEEEVSIDEITSDDDTFPSPRLASQSIIPELVNYHVKRNDSEFIVSREQITTNTVEIHKQISLLDEEGHIVPDIPQEKVTFSLVQDSSFHFSVVSCKDIPSFSNFNTIQLHKMEKEISQFNKTLVSSRMSSISNHEAASSENRMTASVPPRIDKISTESVKTSLLVVNSPQVVEKSQTFTNCQKNHQTNSTIKKHLPPSLTEISNSRITKPTMPPSHVESMYRRWLDAANEIEMSFQAPVSKTKKRNRRPIQSSKEQVLLTSTDLSRLMGCELVALESLSELILTRQGTISVENLHKLCPCLKVLIIKECQLHVMSNLLHFKELRYATLSRNGLRSVSIVEGRDSSDTSIHSQLIYLDLSHNELSVSPSFSSYFPNLIYLDLSHNKLSSFDDAFEEVNENMQILHLNDNHLLSIKSFPLLRGLQELDISNNNLTHFPDLRWCCCLRKLNIRQNSLSEIPANLMNSPLLHFLDISSNAIINLKFLEELWLPSLSQLLASVNNVNEWPHSLYLPSLQILDIRGNQLLVNEELASSLKHCQFLRELYVDLTKTKSNNAKSQFSEWFPNLQRYNEVELSTESTLTSPPTSTNDFENICLQFCHNCERRQSQLYRRLQAPSTNKSQMWRMWERFAVDSLVDCRRYYNFHQTGILRERNEIFCQEDIFTHSERQRRVMAAIKIQAFWRGYRARKWFVSVLQSVKEELANLSGENEIVGAIWSEERETDEFENFEFDDPWDDITAMKLPTETKTSSTVYNKPVFSLGLHESKEKFAPLNNRDLDVPSRTDSQLMDGDNLSVETMDMNSTRKLSERKQGIMKDWNMDNEVSAELLLQRAKKMKLNAQRKKRIENLDPKQRLEFMRRNEPSKLAWAGNSHRSRELPSASSTPYIPHPQQVIPVAIRRISGETLGLDPSTLSVTGNAQAPHPSSRTYQWVFQQAAVHHPPPELTTGRPSAISTTSSLREKGFHLPRISSADNKQNNSSYTTKWSQPSPLSSRGSRTSLPQINGNIMK